jgi:hypothetical protein
MHETSDRGAHGCIASVATFRSREDLMTIVSSEPIVLIGPGSEWLWSAAQFVVVAITLVGIYYQLRLQRAANAFEQIHRIAAEWNSERLVRAKLRVLRAAAFGAHDASAVGIVADFWEEVASLVRAGHVDLSIAYENMGQPLRFWWVLMEDETRRLRDMQGAMAWVHFERMYAVFERRSVGDERRLVIDRAHVTSGLPQRVQDYEDELRLLEELRAIPAPSATSRRSQRPTAAVR